uniref:Chromo domain-containing protein n=1 Tax=Peronospora matthiolae TaxID=2874970 RepID=A0AAV1TWJ3_9STRA
MGNAYTIELPRKMRAHPTFYVGRLRPYYQYEPVSRCEEHLCGRDPRPHSSGPVSTSQSGRLAKRPVHAVERCLDELQPARHEENESNIRSQVVRMQTRHDRPSDRAFGNYYHLLRDHGARVPSPFMSQVIVILIRYTVQLLNIKLSDLETIQVFPPPPHPLVDSGGGQRFLVKRILTHRDVNGVRTSYLVRWCAYPQAWDSWKPRAQLIADVLGLVENYDETHLLRSKKGLQKTPPRTRVQGLQGVNPFGHLSRDAILSVRIIR